MCKAQTSRSLWITSIGDISTAAMNFDEIHMAEHTASASSEFSFLDLVMGVDLTPQNEYMRVGATYTWSPIECTGDSFIYFDDSDASIKPTEMVPPTTIEGLAMPTGDLPELPIEIWTDIFSFATYMPGAYDVNDYTAISGFALDNFGICASNQFKCAMKDKLAISRVSKLWNEISQRFIFQYLRIGSGTQASAIADALEKSRKGKDSRQTSGKYTIRIDIALEGEHAWISKHNTAMVCIFQSCPNLVCFSTAFSTPDPWVYSLPSLIKSLASHRSLRRLEIKVEKDVLRTIEEYLGGSLEVLWLLPCRRLVSLDKSRESYTLPRLRTLVASQRCEAHVQKLTLPNLRACILEGDDIRTLPSIDKRKIEFLSTANLGIVMHDLGAWSSLRTLSIRCSNVATQKIDWSRTFEHHALENIIMDDVVTHLPENLQDHLAKNMPRLVSRSTFPRLKSVKIGLPPRNGAIMKLNPYERDVWESWLQSCQNFGIELEISQGREERIADEWNKISAENLHRLMFPYRPWDEEGLEF